jgi:hypothetical protein
MAVRKCSAVAGMQARSARARRSELRSQRMATIAFRRTHACVGSLAARRCPELSAPSIWSVNSTPEGVRGMPDDPTRSTVAQGCAQSELIGNGVGSDPGDFRAAVGDVDQDAGTLQVPAHIVDRGRHIPFTPKVLAPVPPHRSVQMARHLFQPAMRWPARVILVACFFCVEAEAQFRVKGGRSRWKALLARRNGSPQRTSIKGTSSPPALVCPSHRRASSLCNCRSPSVARLVTMPRNGLLGRTCGAQMAFDPINKRVSRRVRMRCWP